MMRFILAIVLIAVIQVRAENIPEWDSITVTTSEPGQVVVIQAARGQGRLTNLVVTVGTNSIRVPAPALEDVADPQLDSVHFGYWSKDLKQFYVSVRCGRLSSFPGGREPQDVVFHFADGMFFRKEALSAVQRKDNVTAPDGHRRETAPQPAR